MNKDMVVSTEYGLYFGDVNHIYHYDGNNIQVISHAIDRDIDSGVSASGWQNKISAGTNVRMYFLSKFNMIAIPFTSAGVTNIFTYNILKKRWDIRKTEIENADDSIDSLALVNNLLLPSKVGDDVYFWMDPSGKGDGASIQAAKVGELSPGSTGTGRFSWESKDFTMNLDTVEKRFVKLKIEASATLTTNPVVKVDGSTVTLTSSGDNEWKFNKKGRKLKFSFATGNNGIEIYAIGIVYRPLKVR